MTTDSQQKDPSKEPSKDGPKQEKAYDLANFNVLIVEDYSFIAELLSSSLNEMGVGKVTVADGFISGKEKILTSNAVSGNRNIDAVIMDWLMPDGTGHDLLKWVRSHKSDTIKYLPVIICSAYASAEVVFVGRDAGANEVMVKPVSADKLARRILSVIDKPRPYIKTPNFFGPDRRRKVEKYSAEDRRKLKPEDIKEHHELPV